MNIYHDTKLITSLLHLIMTDLLKHNFDHRKCVFLLSTSPDSKFDTSCCFFTVFFRAHLVAIVKKRKQATKVVRYKSELQIYLYCKFVIWYHWSNMGDHGSHLQIHFHQRKYGCGNHLLKSKRFITIRYRWLSVRLQCLQWSYWSLTLSHRYHSLILSIPHSPYTLPKKY